MPTYSATVASPKPAGAVFDYMADFSHTSEWDPNCESAERTSTGEIGAGATFRLTFSGVAGQKLDLDYEIKEYDAPRRFQLVGGNDRVSSVDTIEVEPDGSGCKVTYTAELELEGAFKLAHPILAVGLAKAGSDARKGLEEKLASA